LALEKKVSTEGEKENKAENNDQDGQGVNQIFEYRFKV
jgi:hypothetical protein